MQSSYLYQPFSFCSLPELSEPWLRKPDPVCAIVRETLLPSPSGRAVSLVGGHSGSSVCDQHSPKGHGRTCIGKIQAGWSWLCPSLGLPALVSPHLTPQGCSRHLPAWLGSHWAAAAPGSTLNNFKSVSDQAECVKPSPGKQEPHERVPKRGRGP
jgi:hypothetical protein